MEKFFDLSPKLSKKIIVVLMFLLFFSAIASVFCMILNIIPERTEAPTFSEVLAQQEALYGNKKQDNTAKKEVKKYILIIDEIAKENNLNNYGRNVFVEHLQKIDENLKEEYAKGLKPFARDYYIYMNGKNITEDMLYGVLNDYRDAFFVNNTIKEIKQTTKNIQKTVSMIIFAFSLLLFLLCLLFPLLSRIEKNTRK